MLVPDAFRDEEVVYRIGCCKTRDQAKYHRSPEKRFGYQGFHGARDIYRDQNLYAFHHGNAQGLCNQYLPEGPAERKACPQQGYHAQRETTDKTKHNG